MSANLINGREVAAIIRQEISQKIKRRQQQELTTPGLDVILIGNNPASQSYVGHKQRACQQVGIQSECHRLPEDTSAQTLTALIDQLNLQPQTHGILLQLPLPKHLNPDNFLEHIHPDKDVDGFHPYNFGRLALRQPRLRPCTPYGVMQLLQHTQVDLIGKHAVVVGASNIVGRPMAQELLLAKCTVTVCHRFTTNLPQHIAHADILVCATGQPGIIQSDWIKPGAICIDVGFSKLANGKITGDLDFDSARQRAGWITPVPGGVGPMTVATLLQNTLLAAQLADEIP